MSNGLPLKGQEFDRTLDIVIPFTEQQMDTKSALLKLGNPGVEVTPYDGGDSIVRTYDLTAINALYASIIIKYPKLVALSLPDTLVSLECGFNTAAGDGTNSQTATGEAVGAGSASVSIHSSGQGSASIMPYLIWSIKKTPSGNVIPAIVYLFYMPGNSTIAEILTKLSSAPFASATVNSPVAFAEAVDTLVLTGQNVNVSASADATVSASASSGGGGSFSTGSGSGFSYSFGIENRTIQLPPSIHAALTIATPTISASASSDASAEISAGTGFPPIGATESIGPIAVTGLVTPDTLPATVASAIPVTGNYLVELDVQPQAGFGFQQVRAVVVDFSFFAPFF